MARSSQRRLGGLQELSMLCRSRRACAVLGSTPPAHRSAASAQERPAAVFPPQAVVVIDRLSLSEDEVARRQSDGGREIDLQGVRAVVRLHNGVAGGRVDERANLAGVA